MIMEFLIKRIGRIVLLSSLVVLGSREAFAATPPIVSSATVRVVRVRYQPLATRCLGVDNTITPVAIMAPVGGSNDVLATIAPITHATRVQFTSANTALATVTPAAATGSPQTLTIGGVAHGETTIRARTNTSGILRPLTASVKPRLNRTIALHAITEQNDDVQVIPVGQGEPNQTCVTPGTDELNTTRVGDDVLVGTTTIHTGPNGICDSFAAPDDVQVIPVGQGRPNRPCVTQGANLFRDTRLAVGDDLIAGNDFNSGANGICQTAANATNLVPTTTPTAAALEAYLNQVWGQQANVFFTVTRNDVTLNYDLDRSGVLADPVAASATFAEANAITSAAQTSGVLNVYFINAMEIPKAFTLIARGETWAGDAHPESSENLIAHEVGHLLSSTRESSDPLDVMSAGDPTDPCEVRRIDWNTVNP